MAVWVWHVQLPVFVQKGVCGIKHFAQGCPSVRACVTRDCCAAERCTCAHTCIHRDVVVGAKSESLAGSAYDVDDERG